MSKTVKIFIKNDKNFNYFNIPIEEWDFSEIPLAFKDYEEFSSYKKDIPEDSKHKFLNLIKEIDKKIEKENNLNMIKELLKKGEITKKNLEKILEDI